MKIFTSEECARWFESRGVSEAISKAQIGKNLTPGTIDILFPPGASRLMALVNALTYWELGAQIAVPRYMFWLKEQGIWSDDAEEIGRSLLRQLRMSHGFDENIERTPGHLFESDELIDLR
jgi:hypothetical protein